jgi:hypothetical protein
MCRPTSDRKDGRSRNRHCYWSIGQPQRCRRRGDYAIHGTNRPDSIGGFVSYGCIRMSNADSVDLFDRVDLGTPVIVTR